MVTFAVANWRFDCDGLEKSV